jgi:hypothetical protein
VLPGFFYLPVIFSRYIFIRVKSRSANIERVLLMTNSDSSLFSLLQQARLSYKNAVIYFHRLRFHGVTHNELQSLQEAITTMERFVRESTEGVAEAELKKDLRECILWGQKFRKYYHRIMTNGFADRQAFPEQKFAHARHDAHLMIRVMKELVYMATRFQDELTDAGMSPVLIDDGMALLTNLKRRCAIWDEGVEQRITRTGDIEEEIRTLREFTGKISRAGQVAFQDEPALLDLFQIHSEPTMA